MIQIMRIILIIMAIVCLGGCDKKNTSIYHNIIFKEICDIARDKYLPFCFNRLFATFVSGILFTITKSLQISDATGHL